MKITQKKNGMQPRPYADHEYEWVVELEVGETLSDEIIKEKMLSKDYMGDALPEAEYWKLYRDKNLSFNEHMNVVCKGYYSFRQIDFNLFIVTARREYID